MRYLVDSHDQRATVASARFVAIQRPGNQDCGACLGHADAVALHQIIHEYAAPRGLQSFFAKTSCNIALSSDLALEAIALLFKLAQPSQLRGAKAAEFLLPVVKVASLTPILRQTSGTAVPSSAYFSAKAICSSVYFDLFTAWLLFHMAKSCRISLI
jgi:hypothetical protein